MASRCRSFSRPALSFLVSAAKNAGTARPRSLPSDVLVRPSRSILRVPRELGSLDSMLPLHSAVSSARLTTRLGVDSRGVSRSLFQGMICCSDPGV